jgi:hypothetical protein
MGKINISLFDEAFNPEREKIRSLDLPEIVRAG